MMRRMLTTAGIALFTVLLSVGAYAQPPSSGMEGFEPARNVPMGEQIPGGTMLLIAYGFVWVAMMVYVWSIWQRLNKVESEMRALERRTGSGGSGSGGR